MKKSYILLSLATVAALNAAEPMEPSSMSTDKGGTKAAIDAYSDGAGVNLYNYENRGVVDNSPMNQLVFKYGDSAKENSVTLQNEVKTLSPSTVADKTLADQLSAIASPISVSSVKTGACDDKNENTVNDVYVNNVCTGKLLANPTCADATYTLNATTKNCEKTITSTYAATGNLAGYTISADALSIGQNGLMKYSNGFKITINGSYQGALVYIKPDGTLSGNSTTTNGASYFGIKPVGNGFAMYNSSTGNTGATITYNGTGSISGNSTSLSYGSTYNISLIKTSETLFRFKYVANGTPYESPDVSFVPFYSGYTCASGGTLSGSTCTTTSLSSVAPTCQSGYTYDSSLTKCVQN